MAATRDGIARVLSDRYEVGQEIGRGGMATVYRAVDRRSGARVAIKVMRAEVASPMAAQRFAKEVQLTARLQHPNILPVLDSGDVEGVPYYVMPFVDGESLLERLHRESQLAIDEAIGLCAEIADALGHAHAHGIVHRDIKPSNILISQGHAMVADFGIARVVDEHTPERITSSGLAVGTVHYMSPEQATTDRLDGRSDLYSLGCLLYEMLGGAPPFAGASAQGVIARHAIDPVPSLRTLRATVSPALEAAIARALAKAPADRYASMKEFKSAIQLALTQPDLPVRRRPQRAARWIGGAVAAAAVIAVGVWRFWPRTPALDASRVVVFPLSVEYGAADSGALGENVATMIGNVLDGVGPLRWIDAWPLLDAGGRGRVMTVADAGPVARAAGSRFYVLGRIYRLSGKVSVTLTLFDADGDSLVRRGNADAADGDPVVLARAAANGILPRLVPGAPADATSGWEARDPRAVAAFLLGEAMFRRSRHDEALVHYRQAVAADSAFGLAAIRGAQAASWAHRAPEAASLIAAAERDPLAPRYAAFARGYRHYLDGRADSAAAAFRAAVALDPEMAAGWLQLGETYRHLLPLGGDPDSMALEGYAHAYALDPSAMNAVFHLVEIGARRGSDVGTYARTFLAARPDTLLAREVELTMRCVTDGAGRVDWNHEASIRPLVVLFMAGSLSGGGARLDCAAPALAALLARDTASTSVEADSRRWAAIKLYVAVLRTTAGAAPALAAIDRFQARWGVGSSLILLGAPLDSAFAARAQPIAAADRERYGATYERLAPSTRLWELGLLAVHDGDRSLARALAPRFERAADSLERAGAGDPRRLRAMARSIAVQARVADGDTTGAVADLRRWLPPVDLSSRLTYDEALPLAGERLLLAKLLVSRGAHREALAVAGVFDSPAASIHTLFLPASLSVRLEAAEALRDQVLVTRLRERIRRLEAPQARP